jgi:hypothetical protein
MAFTAINVAFGRALGRMVALVALAAVPAQANGVGENFSWQFMTTADKTNRAFIEDMRQRKKGGAYAPPVYYIERQFNCNIAATATGNQGSTSAFASSPSTSGNVTQAKANDSQNRFDTASAFDLFGFPNSAEPLNDPRTATGLTSTSNQSNTGTVQASTSGDVKTTLSQNESEQVINSNQNSSAPQTASVGNSTACSFGVLN